MKAPATLNARFCETVTRPGRYGDGRGGYGLCLNVKRMANGRTSKTWVQRIRPDGKPTYIGLGRYPLVSLADARKRALENAKSIAKGIDPRTGGIPTFAAALEAVLAIRRGTWRDGGKSEAQWRATLRDFAGRLMSKRVDSIQSGDVLGVVGPIWTAKRATAANVKGRIAKVMDWAIAQGHRTDNPVHAIAAALPKNGGRAEHLKSVPYTAAGDAVRRVRETGAYPTAKLAFEFLVLTAARSGEVRGARWDEIDMDAATWVVPAERMKIGREHRIPLSPRALAVLDEAREYADGSGLVFPSARGLTMQDVALSRIAKKADIDGTVHGMRTSFRMWAAERTNTPREVAEFALAHVVGDVAERAYQRSDLFERRRDLMDRWARYLDAELATVRAIA